MGKSLREMRRLAVDRGRWKEFVEAPLTLWGTMGTREKKKKKKKNDDEVDHGWWLRKGLEGLFESTASEGALRD
jgi:hypothetical protein